jgi:hypothetical protein
VYFEVANEPAPAALDSDIARDNLAWHEAIIAEIVAAEASLPPASKHLIAYNDHYSAGRGIGAIPSPDSVSILNVHYLPKLAEALAEYGKGRVLSLDETRWIAHPNFPAYGNTMKPVSGRLEAWEFIVGGGAVYDGLNYAYQTANPAGDDPESNEFKKYLQKLMQFINGFDFVRMRQDRGVIAAGLPPESIGRAISEPSKQYALYIHHSTYAEGRRYYQPGERPQQFELALDLPAGAYRLEWVRPADLAVLKTQVIEKHPGGKVSLETSPEHREDIALRILSIDRP